MMKLDKDQIIKLRAKLGKWKLPSGEWILLKVKGGCEFGESKTFAVSHFVQSYKPIRRYNVTQKELQDIIARIQSLGFKQIEFAYPELQQFFTSRGEVISDATELRDALEITDDECGEFQGGLDAMLDMYNELENNA